VKSHRNLRQHPFQINIISHVIVIKAKPGGDHLSHLQAQKVFLQPGRSQDYDNNRKTLNIHFAFVFRGFVTIKGSCRLSYLSRDRHIVELIGNLVGVRFDASNEEWIRLENQD
jgi:hypothetical protein